MGNSCLLRYVTNKPPPSSPTYFATASTLARLALNRPESDPVRDFGRSQEAAVALLMATVLPGAQLYNFSFVHTLMTSHAFRVLLPFIHAQFYVGVFHQWWLLVLAVYIAELRPRVDSDFVSGDLGGKGWAYVKG
ncbi:hypothetical protein QBC33DRAFT_605020 [Phialemonium atrogriseum]|uniref:Uncharacterized protein n=1 Tax=Phialemonium atrogriseum TaxID=1093897 RepID=A0AAJ0BPG8_9PEZI|nr:uncharacterized protein QBC33DRAFT_605020 [Phialemonium atrogriseum]KAK1761687.1 hypothetical protein QBC33DRAFT_605020 [Phialemonium atrogriseum]